MKSDVHIIDDKCTIMSVGDYSVCVDKDLSGYDIVALSKEGHDFFSSNVLTTKSLSIVYYSTRINTIFKEGQTCKAIGWLSGDEFIKYIIPKRNG